MSWFSSTVDFLWRVILEIASVFYESSIFILLGFTLAGILFEFVPIKLVASRLGKPGFRSVFLGNRPGCTVTAVLLRSAANSGGTATQRCQQTRDGVIYRFRSGDRCRLHCSDLWPDGADHGYLSPDRCDNHCDGRRYRLFLHHAR